MEKTNWPSEALLTPAYLLRHPYNFGGNDDTLMRPGGALALPPMDMELYHNLRVRQLESFPPFSLPQSLLGPALRLIGGGTTPLSTNNGVMQSIAAGKRPVDNDRGVMMGRPEKRFKVTQKSIPVVLKGTKKNRGGGGFPMPKWAAVVPRKDSNDKPSTRDASAPNKGSVITKSRAGTFPMPLLNGGTKKSVVDQQTSFSSFKTLWTNTKPELRKEVFAMALASGKNCPRVERDLPKTASGQKLNKNKNRSPLQLPMRSSPETSSNILPRAA